MMTQQIKFNSLVQLYTYAERSESVVFDHLPILIQMTFRSEILRVFPYSSIFKSRVKIDGNDTSLWILIHNFC
jgi:hypothetical protein